MAIARRRKVEDFQDLTHRVTGDRRPEDASEPPRYGDTEIAIAKNAG